MAAKRSGVNASRLASQNMDDACGGHQHSVAHDTAPSSMPVCSATPSKSANVFSLMLDGQRLLAAIPERLHQGLLSCRNRPAPDFRDPKGT